MRSENEMFNLVLKVAKNDKRVRAVLLNGSRANSGAAKDIYQDFDIVYMVTEVESFTRDHRWIDVFGKRIMLQMPETMRNPEGDYGNLWAAVFTACELFRTVGVSVTDFFGFNYNQLDDTNMMNYLNKVKNN